MSYLGSGPIDFICYMVKVNGNSVGIMFSLFDGEGTILMSVQRQVAHLNLLSEEKFANAN